MSQRYFNIIAGERLPSSSGESVEIRSPADVNEVVGVVQSSSLADVQAAIQAAKAAFVGWAGLPAPERGRILHRAASLLEGRIESWAVELTREEGKTLGEARGEVGRVVEIMRYFAGEGWRVGGDVLPADTPHTLLYSLRVPVGVVALITPWNFPLSIPAWKMMPALVTGNTVVFKPASATPITGLRLVELLHEAGLPPGVVNIFTGRGGALGDALVTQEDVNAVSFTGSYSIGNGIYQKTAPRMTRTHLEMGGKNPVIVAADADLEKAARLTVAGGFGLTRTGLHRHQPGDRRAGRRRRVYCPPGCYRKRFASGAGPGGGSADGPGGECQPAPNGPGIYSNWPGRRCPGCGRRRGAANRGFQARSLHPADGSDRRAFRDAGSTGRDLWASD